MKVSLRGALALVIFVGCGGEDEVEQQTRTLRAGEEPRFPELPHEVHGGGAPPVLDPIPNQSGSENTLLTFQATATDNIGNSTAQRTQVRVSEKSPAAVFAKN